MTEEKTKTCQGDICDCFSDFATEYTKLQPVGMSESKVAHLVKQILEALDFMHQENLPHLVLNPKHILLCDAEEYPRLKLNFSFTSLEAEKIGSNVTNVYFRAPEVWQGIYSKNSDMWSVGILSFLMIFGFFPFYDDYGRKMKPNHEEIKRQIEDGFKIETKKGCGPWFPEAISVSDAAKAFISRLLQMDSCQRYSVKDALSDPWIQGNAFTNDLPEIVVDGLNQLFGNGAFAEVSKLNSLISKQEMTCEEKCGIEGQITKEQFVDRIRKTSDMRLLKAETIFDYIDEDCDGYINVGTGKLFEVLQRLITVADHLVSLPIHECGDTVKRDELQPLIDQLSSQEKAILNVDSMLKMTEENVMNNANMYALEIRQRSSNFITLLNRHELHDGVDYLSYEEECPFYFHAKPQSEPSPAMKATHKMFTRHDIDCLKVCMRLNEEDRLAVFWSDVLVDTIAFKTNWCRCYGVEVGPEGYAMFDETALGYSLKCNEERYSKYMEDIEGFDPKTQIVRISPELTEEEWIACEHFRRESGRLLLDDPARNCMIRAMWRCSTCGLGNRVCREACQACFSYR